MTNELLSANTSRVLRDIYRAEGINVLGQIFSKFETGELKDMGVITHVHYRGEYFPSVFVKDVQDVAEIKVRLEELRG